MPAVRPQARARVGKLLRSVKWTVELIDRYLLEKADEEVEKLKEQRKRILCLWDGSVVEKAESEKSEGLCPVLSVPRQTASPHETRVCLQLACSSPSSGDGDAMECRPDRRNGWASASGRDEVVDDERRFCHEAARHRRRALTSHGQEMGSFTRACL